MSRRRHLYHPDSLPDQLADWVTGWAGSWSFILGHVGWFAGWIILRIEPFPFGLLTMIVSLEAIFLTSLVMLSGNRQVQKDRKRDDLEAQEVESMYAMMNELHAINATQLDILHILREHLVCDGR